MKFVPHSVTRAVATQMLHANKNAPNLLFVAGVAGVVGSTVLACRATLKLEEELTEVSDNLADVRLRAEPTNTLDYSDNLKKDITKVYLFGAAGVAKLYAPAFLLGSASIFCLTKSHNILQDRNLALTAAYTAVDQAFKRYRENVVEDYGPDIDRRMRYETEEYIYTDEHGEEMCEIRINVDAEPSMYAQLFDQMSPYWGEEPEYNLAWLHHKQVWFNHLLTMRGYVFLNEVYEDLGILRTEAGDVVGWFLGNGDSFIDFGIFTAGGSASFVNGREASILLDFNVDGSIYHLLDQIDHTKKKGFTPWQR